MKFQKINSTVPKKKRKRKVKIAAIASLSLLCGITLSELSPVISYAESASIEQPGQEPALTHTDQAGQPGTPTDPAGITDGTSGSIDKEPGDSGTDNHPVPPAPQPQQPEEPANPLGDNQEVYDGKDGDSKWELDKNGNLTIEAGTMNTDTISKNLKADKKTITSITFKDGVKLPAIAAGLFKDFSGLTIISGTPDTSNTNDMSSMFSGDSALNSSEPFSNWDTSNVTTMESMFAGTGIETFSLSNWNVSNVSTMDSMFSNSKLNKLEATGWKLSNSVSDKDMFSGTNVSFLNIPSALPITGAGIIGTIAGKGSNSGNDGWIQWRDQNYVQDAFRTDEMKKINDEVSKYPTVNLQRIKLESYSASENTAQVKTNIADPKEITGTAGGNIGTVSQVLIYQSIPGYTLKTDRVWAIVTHQGILIVDPDNTGRAIYSAQKWDKAEFDVKTNIPYKPVIKASASDIKYGEEVNVKLPEIDGYTTPTGITGTVDKDGKVTVKDTANYVEIGRSGSIEFTYPDGSKQTFDYNKLKYDTPQPITLKDIEGYSTPKAPQLKIDKDGKVVFDGADYTAHDFTYKYIEISGPHHEKVIRTFPDIKFGKSEKIDMPDFDGYVTPENVTVSVSSDGQSLKVSEYKYEPKVFKNRPVTVTLPDKTNKDITIDQITYGEDKQVELPDVEGFDTPKEVTASVDKDGNVTLKNAEYKYSTSKDKQATLTLPDKTTKDFSFKEMTVGTPVDIDLPDIAGYDKPTKSQATLDKKGEVVFSNTDYAAHTWKNVSVKVQTPEGEKTVGDLTATYLSKVSITLPQVAGYTTDKPVITASVNPDGTLTLDEKPNYVPDNAKGTLAIKTNMGDQVIENLNGKVGTTIDVPVKEITGYTPDKSKVKAIINSDKTISTVESVVYSPNHVKTDVTINTSQGPQVVKDQEGLVGQHITIKVPKIDGYKTEQKTVDGKVNPDGSITVSEKVSYIQDYLPDESNNNGNGNSIQTGEPNETDNSNQNNNSLSPFLPHFPNPFEIIQNVITKIVRVISILFNKVGIHLFNSNLEEIDNRSLSSGSDWYSDQQMVKDGKTYYRVSNNEWVLADYTYEYNQGNRVITTHSGNVTPIFNALGHKSDSRALGQNTDWSSDRTITMNGKTYYRVSTDEFVSQDDVTVK